MTADFLTKNITEKEFLEQQIFDNLDYWKNKLSTTTHHPVLAAFTRMRDRLNGN